MTPRSQGALRPLLCAALATLLALSPPAFALSPLQKNHPLVESGMEAYRQGKYDEALKAFDAAKEALPNSASVEFDRGNALFKLGRMDDAKDAWTRAAQLDHGELAAQDYYNLGNAWAELGRRPEALAAYRKALTLDPHDAQARHNFEVMLKNLPPPQSGLDGGTDGGQDGGKGDGGTDGGRDGGEDGGTDGGKGQGDAGMDGGRADAGAPDAGRDGGHGDGGSDAGMDGGRGDGGADGGQDGGPGEQQQNADGGSEDAGWDGGQAIGEGEVKDGGELPDLTQQDAEKLLDSMKRNEKNLQLWRFQQRKPRKPNDKDW